MKTEKNQIKYTPYFECNITFENSLKISLQ